MAKSETSFKDAGFQKALKQYLNLKKNVEPKKELRRRAKNIGIKLVKIYKEKGAKLDVITTKVKSLGNRVKIRSKIRSKRGKKWTHARMIAAELRARRSAKGFTATGWFPSVVKLGGNPRDTARRTGPRRGKLIESLGGNNISETLVNQQPGAAHVKRMSKTLEQQAMDAETADMVKYIARKQNEAARKAGL